MHAVATSASSSISYFLMNRINESIESNHQSITADRLALIMTIDRHLVGGKTADRGAASTHALQGDLPRAFSGKLQT